jgi:hypothetical protein
VTRLPACLQQLAVHMVVNLAIDWHPGDFEFETNLKMRGKQVALRVRTSTFGN